MSRSRLKNISLDRLGDIPSQPPRRPVHAKPASSAAKAPSEVRLIGGQWKRSKLPVLDAEGLRPTPDRVRETLFNWLGQDLEGWRCLDAFAGSGALGFEAASRGADDVVLLERDAPLLKSLKAVQERLKATQVRIEAADAMAWLARCAPATFELVFIDPPFAAQLFEAAVNAAQRVVVPDGFIYLEADRAFTAEAFAPGLRLHRQGRAGAVHFHLFQRAGTA
jgi:16S rRNA (guanine966-N2)-methyltransferase